MCVSPICSSILPCSASRVFDFFFFFLVLFFVYSQEQVKPEASSWDLIRADRKKTLRGVKTVKGFKSRGSSFGHTLLCLVLSFVVWTFRTLSPLVLEHSRDSGPGFLSPNSCSYFFYRHRLSTSGGPDRSSLLGPISGIFGNFQGLRLNQESMNSFPHVPPGFRFHPTDEELVDYYLRRKVTSRRIDLDVIKDVDLYKIEPWDLQELCRLGTEEQNEWYFFSHKDKKYPTGTRTNRATAAGFWKATGRDKAIYSKHDLIGMRKTLVFYKGRAPNGQKSDWIMHEYRLETDENGAPQEEGWVVCRVFKKRIASTQKLSEHDSPIWYDDHVSFMPEMESPKQHSYTNNLPCNFAYTSPSCKKEMSCLQYGSSIPHADHNQFLQLPLLESPKVLQPQLPFHMQSSSRHVHQTLDQNFQSVLRNNNISDQQLDDQVTTDWRVLDKFVASQLSQEEITKEISSDAYPASEHHSNLIVRNLDKQEILGQENASTSSSSCQIDLWK